ncbi:MAG TPA: endonuclease NucS [Mycobacteriales bacterium]|nr:endonuclease NucS [Mycobacteriales bacterium]
MRLVLARCTVDYVGRLTAHLPEAVRLLVCKADGSLLVHSDTGGYKPLMWMTPPCTIVHTDALWTVTNKGGEQLVVTVHEVISDTSHDLGTDPGLVKDGVEKHLQALLAEQLHVLGDGFELVQREYFTDIGPVDLLVRDAAGLHVLVEVKRHAEIDGVEQLTRYLQRVSTVLGQVNGILAAQSFKPQAKVLAADRGITCVQLDYDELRGMESQRPTLF